MANVTTQGKLTESAVDARTKYIQEKAEKLLEKT